MKFRLIKTMNTLLLIPTITIMSGCLGGSDGSNADDLVENRKNITPARPGQTRQDSASQLTSSNRTFNAATAMNDMMQNKKKIASVMRRSEAETSAAFQRMNSAYPTPITGNSYGSYGNNSSSNPFSSTSAYESTSNAGPSEPIDNTTIGSLAGSITANAHCGMSISASGENERRIWFTEASNNPNYTDRYRTDQDLDRDRSQLSMSDVTGNFGSICEALQAQVSAFTPALNQSLTAARKLYDSTNTMPIQCDLNEHPNSASRTSMCAAVSIIYGMKVVSHMCHKVCSDNK